MDLISLTVSERNGLELDGLESIINRVKEKVEDNEELLHYTDQWGGMDDAQSLAINRAMLHNDLIDKYQQVQQRSAYFKSGESEEPAFDQRLGHVMGTQIPLAASNRDVRGLEVANQLMAISRKANPSSHLDMAIQDIKNDTSSEKATRIRDNAIFENSMRINELEEVTSHSIAMKCNFEYGASLMTLFSRPDYLQIAGMISAIVKSYRVKRIENLGTLEVTDQMAHNHVSQSVESARSTSFYLENSNHANQYERRSGLLFHNAERTIQHVIRNAFEETRGTTESERQNLASSRSGIIGSMYHNSVGRFLLDNVGGFRDTKTKITHGMVHTNMQVWLPQSTNTVITGPMGTKVNTIGKFLLTMNMCLKDAKGTLVNAAKIRDVKHRSHFEYHAMSEAEFTALNVSLTKVDGTSFNACRKIVLDGLVATPPLYSVNQYFIFHTGNYPYDVNTTTFAAGEVKRIFKLLTPAVSGIGLADFVGTSDFTLRVWSPALQVVEGYTDTPSWSASTTSSTTFDEAYNVTKHPASIGLWSETNNTWLEYVDLPLTCISAQKTEFVDTLSNDETGAEGLSSSGGEELGMISCTFEVDVVSIINGGIKWRTPAQDTRTGHTDELAGGETFHTTITDKDVNKNLADGEHIPLVGDFEIRPNSTPLPYTIDVLSPPDAFSSPSLMQIPALETLSTQIARNKANFKTYVTLNTPGAEEPQSHLEQAVAVLHGGGAIFLIGSGVAGYMAYETLSASLQGLSSVMTGASLGLATVNNPDDAMKFAYQAFIAHARTSLQRTALGINTSDYSAANRHLVDAASAYVDLQKSVQAGKKYSSGRLKPKVLMALGREAMLTATLSTTVQECLRVRQGSGARTSNEKAEMIIQHDTLTTANKDAIKNNLGIPAVMSMYNDSVLSMNAVNSSHDIDLDTTRVGRFGAGAERDDLGSLESVIRDDAGSDHEFSVLRNVIGYVVADNTGGAHPLGGIDYVEDEIANYREVLCVENGDKDPAAFSGFAGLQGLSEISASDHSITDKVSISFNTGAAIKWLYKGGRQSIFNNRTMEKLKRIPMKNAAGQLTGTFEDRWVPTSYNYNPTLYMVKLQPGEALWYPRKYNPRRYANVPHERGMCPIYIPLPSGVELRTDHTKDTITGVRAVMCEPASYGETARKDIRVMRIEAGYLVINRSSVEKHVKSSKYGYIVPDVSQPLGTGKYAYDHPDSVLMTNSMNHGYSFEWVGEYMDEIDVTSLTNDEKFDIMWRRKIMGFSPEWGNILQTDGFDWAGIYNAWLRNNPGTLINTRIMDRVATHANMHDVYDFLRHARSCYTMGMLSVPGQLLGPGLGYNLVTSVPGTSMKPFRAFDTTTLVSHLRYEHTEESHVRDIPNGLKKYMLITGDGNKVNPGSIVESGTGLHIVNATLVIDGVTVTGDVVRYEDHHGRIYEMPQCVVDKKIRLICPDLLRFGRLEDYSFVKGNHCRTWARGFLNYLAGTGKDPLSLAKKYEGKRDLETMLESIRFNSKKIGIGVEELDSEEQT